MASQGDHVISAKHLLAHGAHIDDVTAVSRRSDLILTFFFLSYSNDIHSKKCMKTRREADRHLISL